MSRRARAYAWASLAWLFVSSCSTDPLTQIVVVVDADDRDWTRVELRVDGFRQPTVVEADLAVKPFPRRFSLVHEGGPPGPVSVIARAFSAGSDEPVLIEPRTGMFFVLGETKLLRIDLLRECVDACAPGQACLAVRGCVSSDEAAVLEPWTGNVEPLLPAMGGAGGDTMPPGDVDGGPDTAPVGGAVGGAGSGGVDPGPDGAVSPPWDYRPSNFDPDGVAGRVSVEHDVVLDCGDSSFDSTSLAFTNFCDTEAGIGVDVVKQLDGSEAVVLAMNDFTIVGDATLRFGGGRPIILAVYGDATIRGRIDASGSKGVGGPGGGIDCSVGAGSSGAASTGGDAGSGGGSGGGFGSAGGRGGSNGSTSTRVDGGETESDPGLAPLRGGCPGGKGGATSDASIVGVGGGAGGALQISVRGRLAIDGTVAAGGGGGGAGSQAKDGGGGGGSGGGILLEGAPVEISAAAFVTANGGAGGGGQPNAGTASAQAGGDGALASVDPASGGASASTGGDGGRGGAFASNAVDGENPTGAFAGLSLDYGAGGGGGGGVGRIRIRGAASCIPPGGISPAAVVDCPGCGACPATPTPGCLPATLDGGVYYVCAAAEEWDVANEACVAAGMHLVRIDAADEDMWLRGLVPGGAWIGANDQESDGVWKWVDDGAQFWMGQAIGTPIGGRYVAWAVAEPSNAFGFEDCGKIQPSGWVDDTCSSSESFVCEQ